jgi:hypothetical protein
MGRPHVQSDIFVGKIDHPTLGLCQFREHLVVRDGEVLHTIDEFTCG